MDVSEIPMKALIDDHIVIKNDTSGSYTSWDFITVLEQRCMGTIHKRYRNIRGQSLAPVALGWGLFLRHSKYT